MPHFGLIGYPLEHSFSVSFFTKKFREEGIDAEYRNFPLKEIAGFEALVSNEPGLVGLNVTVPYKQAIMPYLDALHPTARAVGAVNTIFFCRKQHSLTLLGYNTDVIGFERSLREQDHESHKKALILGTGGSSKAVAFVLENMGLAFRLVSRTGGEDVLTYGELDPEMIKSHTLIINTTPLGMHPNVDTFPPIPYDALTSGHLLFDLVYNPELSRFLSKGKERGAAIVNGSDMLVYQAEESWRIWTKER